MFPVLLLMLGSALAGAGPSVASYPAFLRSLPTPECTAAVESTQILEKLWALEGWPGQAGSGEFPKELTGWSTDYLLEASRRLIQEAIPRCPDVALVADALSLLQGAYLARLGLGAVPPSQRDGWFRALVAVEADRKRLSERLRHLGPGARVEGLYPGAGRLRDVWLFSAGAKPTIAGLEKALARLCPKENFCPFWNSRALFKVLLVPAPRAAGYAQETATLVLGEDLARGTDLLSQLILIHELTHVATRTAQVNQGRDWTREFAVFSGWDVEATERTPVVTGSRRDLLTRLSEKSGHGILPDPVIAAIKIGERSYEGFAFARGFRRTRESGDPEEDLADHVAAFILTPERFCDGPRPIAPKKYHWIAKEVFSRPARLSCGSPAEAGKASQGGSQ